MLEWDCMVIDCSWNMEYHHGLYPFISDGYNFCLWYDSLFNHDHVLFDTREISLYIWFWMHQLKGQAMLKGFFHSGTLACCIKGCYLSYSCYLQLFWSSIVCQSRFDWSLKSTIHQLNQCCYKVCEEVLRVCRLTFGWG